MRRRELLALICLAPLAAHGQDPARVRRVAVMVSTAESDSETRPRLVAFAATLRALGWSEGRNIEIVHRYGAGNAELMRRQAAELLALKPDLMVVQSNLALDAARRELGSVPVVFLAVSDPVGSGYVKSLSHPGGNLTGFTNFEPTMGAKWLQVLKEIAPAVARVTVLLNPTIAANREFTRSVEAAAPAMGVSVAQEASTDLAAKVQAIAQLGRERNGGIISMPNPGNAEQRKELVAACAQYRVPAIYPFSYFARDGGLVSYGLDLIDMYRSTAGYVDRILKGAQPAELAVQQPTRYELSINLKAANALGLKPSPSLLARANVVFE